MRRLALIRYLEMVGQRQSREPEPMAALSTLTFHDAVEMFLVVALAHLGESRKELRFMEYWDFLNTKLAPSAVSQKETMRRLNDIRGALKHQGILPGALEIEAARVNTRAFLEENTPVVFGIAFDSISLAQLVSRRQTRDLLAASESAIAAGDFQAAQAYLARAFASVIDNAPLRTRPGIYGNPLGVGQRLEHLSPPFGMDPDLRRALGQMTEEHNKTRTTIVSLQETVFALALGLDYRRYVTFKNLTPPIRVDAFDREGRALAYEPGVWTSPVSLSSQDAHFCLDFVLDAALKLQ